MKQQKLLFFIVSLSLFLSSCNSKVIPTTATEDTLSMYRKQYTYEREKFVTPEKGISVVVDLEPDTTWIANFDVTQYIHHTILDYVPKPKRKPDTPMKISGFRVQIYRGRSRQDAEEARRISFGLFPRQRPYLIHEIPTYRVQVGDFINEQECRPIYRVLRKKFPTALIVPSIVEIIVAGEEY